MRYLIAFLLLAAPAYAETVTIERSACKVIQRYHEVPGAAYQEGVDVHGQPVIPADLGSRLSIMPDVITIPLQVDVAHRLGIPMGAAKGSEATVGMITVEGDKIYLNGQSLTPEQGQEVAVLCGEIE